MLLLAPFGRSAAIMKVVPQRSILGPILFNIFMNDLSYAIDKCTLFTHADDTQLFKSVEDIDQVEHAINADLKRLMSGMNSIK